MVRWDHIWTNRIRKGQAGREDLRRDDNKDNTAMASLVDE
jgi:hypothetical protein